MGPTCLDTECRLRGPAGWRDQTGLVRTGYRKELRTLGCQKGGDGLAPAPKGRVYVTGGPGSQDRDSRVERGTAGVYQGASCPSAPPLWPEDLSGSQRDWDSILSLSPCPQPCAWGEEELPDVGQPPSVESFFPGPLTPPPARHLEGPEPEPPQFLSVS